MFALAALKGKSLHGRFNMESGWMSSDNSKLEIHSQQQASQCERLLFGAAVKICCHGIAMKGIRAPEVKPLLRGRIQRLARVW